MKRVCAVDVVAELGITVTHFQWNTRRHIGDVNQVVFHVPTNSPLGFVLRKSASLDQYKHVLRPQASLTPQLAALKH